MSKSTGIWDTVLKVIIAVASAVLGVFRSQRDDVLKE